MEQNQFRQTRRSLRLHDSFQKNVLTQKKQKSDKLKPEMGSKTLSNKVKQDNTCDVCDNKFQTVQALRSHKNAKHPDEKLKTESTPEPRPKAAPKNTPMSRASKRLRLKKGNYSDESEESEDIEEKKSKIAFSCPKCSKTFSIYFQALKHIQKRHCVDSEGNPVPADSPDIIKPLTIEDSMTHNEMETSPEQYNYLFCLGCDQHFRSVVMFNRHASFMHRENVDSMFFKTMEEFNMWKQMMETQVRVKYLSLKHQTSQKYYHCNYVSPNNDFDKTYLCPSVIDVKELQTGIQIHYGKDHFGHTCPTYKLPERFVQYLTSKKEIIPEKEPFHVLYMKLKDLLEDIGFEAKKASYSQLERLYNSATKMRSSFDDEKEHKLAVIKRSMTDVQITDVLEGKRSSARLKRKSETVTVDAKKTKLDIPDDDSNKSKTNEVKSTKENQLESVTPSSPALMSPSFNDSYKQFIGSPEPVPTKTNKRKEIVKTKIGQFSPKRKETIERIEKDIVRKPNILKPSKTNTAKILKYEVKEQENGCNILILKI